MEERLPENLQDAFLVLRDFVGCDQPVCALILGSGLNEFANQLQDSRFLDFCDVPHMKQSTCDGHVGRFVLGVVPGTQATILCMQGRLHGYEGYSAQQVAFPVWVMSMLGISVLVTTNAAGALNAQFSVGDFCLMRDHVNFTGRNPIVGQKPNSVATRFVPMMNAYDPALRRMMLESACEQGISVGEGTYFAVLGPSFETPAEIRAFKVLGADTVAMSVVEEVIAARHVGMRVLGMSLISNMACGIKDGDPHLEDINDVIKVANKRFPLLMTSFINKLQSSLK